MEGLLKRRQKLSLRADDLHSVGIKKIAWLIEGIYVNAKWWNFYVLIILEMKISVSHGFKSNNCNDFAARFCR